MIKMTPEIWNNGANYLGDYVHFDRSVWKWCARRGTYLTADPVYDLQARLCWQDSQKAVRA